MEAVELLNNYSRVYYRATNGQFYKLCNVYPICLRVSGSDELFYLDTGGPMGGSIDFFKAKIVGVELHRECDDGVWRRISPEVVIR